jgi:hypothetical protein
LLLLPRPAPPVSQWRMPQLHVPQLVRNRPLKVKLVDWNVKFSGRGSEFCGTDSPWPNQYGPPRFAKKVPKMRTEYQDPPCIASREDQSIRPCKALKYRFNRSTTACVIS